MQTLSPPARRILALGILVLFLLLGTSVASTMAGSMLEALSELEDQRFRVARLTALSQRPAPEAGQPVPADLSLQAGSREAAEAELAGAVSAAAHAAGAAIDGAVAIPADPANPSLIRLSFGATGPEPALLSFINQLEQQRPAVRLPEWRMSTDEGTGQLRMQAVALAVWETGR